jgi:single-stranded-DNA-specific exonuclease
MNCFENRWSILPEKTDLQESLQKELKISPLLSRLLVNRNITAPQAAQKFLSSTLRDLNHPFLMKGMKRACRRIAEAVYQKEKICIYGDYDADGVTGTAVLKLFLESLGAPVTFYIPERLTEGYGLHFDALEKIRALGTSLVITVDCGISEVEAVRFAREQGLDTIVTDHHHVPDSIPDAYAVLNPKQRDCSFPFKHLSGAGVAFYLVIGLRKILRDEGFWNSRNVPNLREYLDLVALGTLADIVPLVGDNRIFVRYGLDVLKRSNRVGITALKKVSRIDEGVITPEMVSFRLAPRINAAGRLGRADKAVQLLSTTDSREAETMAFELDEANTERQNIEGTIFNQACQIIEEADTQDPQNVIVLSSSEWHPGVIGIAASRLVGRYYRPTILIAVDGETGRGSARSIEAFHIYEGLKHCQEVLERFGGHEFAAGLTVAEDNIDALRLKLNALVAASLSPEDFVPKIYIDAQLDIASIDEALIEEIQCLGPFGTNNPEPLFLSDVFTASSPHIVGNGHLKMRIGHNGSVVDVIGFSMGDLMPQPDAPIQTVFVPQINIWQGNRKIQLTMKDLRVVDGS